MSEEPKYHNASVIAQVRVMPQKRNFSKVPFVELWGGRLQGVVSSKSDYKRVYVSFVEAGTTDFYCSTNNNRPCGGLRGGYCKHLGDLLQNAVAQYGSERIITYLRLDTTQTKLDARAIARLITGSQKKLPANEVFSRFLNYLRYVQLAPATVPVPEMNWFLTG